MRLLIALIAILAVLFVTGCSLKPTPEVPCDTYDTASQRNECQFNLSVRKLDASGCTDILNDKMRQDCIDEIAIRVLDIYPCRMQDKMVKRDACENKVSEAKRKAKEAAANP